MIGHLTRAFEALIDGLAIANLILMTAAGFFAGFFISANFYLAIGLCIAIGCGGAVLGLIIGYIFDVVVFGFFAQVIEIRKLIVNRQ